MKKVFISVLVGAVSYLAFGQWYPWNRTNILLGIIHSRQPLAYSLMYWGWELSSFFALFFVSLAFQVNGKDSKKSIRVAMRLPVYVEPQDRQEFSLVIGEGETTGGGLEWVSVPEKGCHNGIMIVGGTGRAKTQSAMLPIARQLVFYRKDSSGEKLSGLVLEPKGDFCGQIREILVAAGRGDDYYEIGPDSTTTYNPLDTSLDSHELAFSLGALIEQSRGRKSHDPFWRDAYSNAIQNLVDLYRICDGWVTLRDVYRGLVSDEWLISKMAEAQKKMEGEVYYSFTREDYLKKDKTLKPLGAVPAEEWDDPELKAEYGRYVAPWSAHLEEYLKKDIAPPFKRLEEGINFRVENGAKHTPLEREHWDAVKFALTGWFNLEDKLRASIVETCRGALRIFDDPELRRKFCPAKNDPNMLPPLVDLIESGKWVGVNFPPSSNASLSRFVNIMLKLRFENEVLRRIESGNVGRSVALLADEYDQVASVGLNEPVGDDKTFSRSRQAKLIAVVAVHSFSSLQAQIGEYWRSVAQHFSTKIIMGLTDDFTAKICEDLLGHEEQWREGYNLGESGKATSVDPLTQKIGTTQAGISAGTNYSLHMLPIVPQEELFELPTAAAWTRIYTGRDSLRARKIYLKPSFAAHDMPWSEQRQRLII